MNGCPDSDSDGVADNEDECPEEEGLVEFNGCPDTDTDGVADKDDQCPNEPGAVENKVAPGQIVMGMEYLIILIPALKRLVL